MVFLCLISKFPLFKLFDLILRKIYNDLDAEVEVGLTPYKTNKFKALKFYKYKAQRVRLSDDYTDKDGFKLKTDGIFGNKTKSVYEQYKKDNNEDYAEAIAKKQAP